MAEEDPDAVLSDVDGDDPAPIVLSNSSVDDATFNQRLLDLQSDLDRERQSRKLAENAHFDLQNKFARLKVLAQEAIRKRDEAQRERDEAVRSLEDISKQKEVSRSEIEVAAQMLVTGIEKISGKVGRFISFGSSGLPKSQKYVTGLPSIVYGVTQRSSEIVDELVQQVDLAVKERNEARMQVEQRNYEIAIEVSQLEATIGALREDVKGKTSEIGGLEKAVGEKDGKIGELEEEVTRLRVSGDECEARRKVLEEKLDSQKSVVMDILKNISRTHEQVSEIVENVGSNEWNHSDFSDSQFIWKEMDVEVNLRTSLEGIVSLFDVAKIASDRVRVRLEERKQEVEVLSQKVEQLLADKNHIGSLLRNALSSKMGEMRKMAQNGNLKTTDPKQEDPVMKKEDEVYRLAGVLEDTVKASQLEIIGLQHQVEALRAECGLLKGQLSAHTKEIALQKHRIRELEEKERLANESVEGLIMDIAAAEEEVARWKLAAEQEAAAGRAIEQDFESQVSSIRKELEDSKLATSELENKLKVKEETSIAAIAARDAAEKSLRLADMRSARLRERLEELTQQLSESEISESTNIQRQRYFCWPWNWLGLTVVPNSGATRENSNEMELSEPLM